MKLEDFNKLSFDEKLYMVVDKGTFIDNYVTNDIRMNCYAVERFFVELVYCPEKNKIIEVRSFNSGIDLDKYIDRTSYFN